jgi:peptide/nickel transport system ATP-binding protein
VPQPILSVRNLSTGFSSSRGYVPAVQDVSFAVHPNRTLCIVGESGCGKSVTALSIMRLLDSPPARISADSLRFKDVDILDLTEEEMRSIRGKDMAMVFQEPMVSLNPLLRVGEQVLEPMLVHMGISRKDAFDRAVELLEKVGIPAARKRANEYPHQMSGGMRQRVMIAMALSCGPELLIADEPTTALDMTIQAQILGLIKQLQAELGMSVILITHSLGVVARMADDVVVMYAGQVVEQGTVYDIFRAPAHPYTVGLFGAIPSVAEKVPTLRAIPGSVPNPLSYPKACRFAPRCERAQKECVKVKPALVQVADGHYARCMFPLQPDRSNVT